MDLPYRNTRLFFSMWVCLSLIIANKKVNYNGLPDKKRTVSHPLETVQLDSAIFMSSLKTFQTRSWFIVFVIIVNQAHASCSRQYLGSMFKMELMHDLCHVVFYCAWGGPILLSNLFIRKALGHQR